MSIAAAAAGAALRPAAPARASWRGALFTAAVWLVCRLARRLPAFLRCALWWTASLKLVLTLAWPAPLVLPLLPAAAAPERSEPPAAAARPTAGPAAAATRLAAARPTALAPAPPQPAAPFGPPRPAPALPPWAAGLLAAAWGAGLLLQLGWLARQLRRCPSPLPRS